MSSLLNTGRARLRQPAEDHKQQHAYLAAKAAANALGVDDHLVHRDAQHAVDSHLMLSRRLCSEAACRSALAHHPPVGHAVLSNASNICNCRLSQSTTNAASYAVTHIR